MIKLLRNTCINYGQNTLIQIQVMVQGLLFENRPALYFCNYKENKKNNIRMLDTLFNEDFIDSMEEYFHF